VAPIKKLREVYSLIDLEESSTQKTFGIGKSETLIRVQFFVGIKRTSLSDNNANPIHHISEIDLNN